MVYHACMTKVRASKLIKKALYWYTKAADNGDTQAMHNLGVMYYKGDGIEKNSDLAKKYFEQACELKFKESCYILHKGMK